MPGNVSGASGAQASLVLLVLIFLLAIMARSTIGDAIVSVANEFAKFRVWGVENSVDNLYNDSPSGSLTTSAYNATVVSMDLPTRMIKGDTYSATITMKNTGIACWYADGEYTVTLGAIGGANREAYNLTKKTNIAMLLGTIIRQNETYSFNFNIVASITGTYHPGFQMTSNEIGSFGEIATQTISVVDIATPTPTSVPTLKPTIVPTAQPTPYNAYVAYGKFLLYGRDGTQQIGGPWYWIYDGPYGQNNLRSSYFSDPSWPYPDWDIGGPNGQYRIYKAGCTGSMSFSMNNGGFKGTVVFHVF